MGRKYNLHEHHADFLELTELNMSDAEIARAMGVPTHAVKGYREYNNLPHKRRPGSPPIPEENLEVTKSMTERNYSVKQIASKLGVSRRTVANYRRRLGIVQEVHRPWTEEDQKKSEMFLEDGASLYEVGRTLKRSPTSVKYHVPDAPRWTAEEGGQFWHAIERTERKIGSLWT